MSCDYCGKYYFCLLSGEEVCDECVEKLIDDYNCDECEERHECEAFKRYEQILEKEYRERYLRMFNMSGSDVIGIDGKRYSYEELKAIIDKAWMYDELNK